MSLALTFRRLFLESVLALPDAPILLSGGIDSATLLAASLKLGRRPSCYTFQFGEYPSPDAKVAAKMAHTFATPFHLVKVPRTSEEMIYDARRVIAITRKSRKTHVQCSIPFWYLARAIKADGFGSALMAMSADDFYGNSRAAQVALRTGGPRAFRAHNEHTHHDPEQSDWSCVKVALSEGVAIFDAFRNQYVASFLLDRSYEEMNKPRQKQLIIDAFPEFWRRGAWYRENASLQVVSGIRDAHDTLLRHPINRRGHKAVIGLYNEFLKESL